MENIDDLIQKYQNHCISDDEIIALEKWVKSSTRNASYFKDRVAQDYLLTRYSRKDTQTPAFKKLVEAQKPPVRKMVSSYVLKYAAVWFVGLLTSVLGYYYYTQAYQEVYDPGKITFTYANGDSINLDDTQETVLKDKQGNPLGYQDHQELNFATAKTQSLAYNTLRVPKGKRLTLILADSSRVYLNSESTLRFPSHFPDTGKRELFLTGEGFFEVTKDPNRPFHVNAESLDVEVLGTRFNVNAYTNYENITTTLVEGSVKISHAEEEVVLVPGEAGAFVKSDAALLVEQVNVANNIAWIENRLLFIDEPFETIMHKIERGYGVKIVNKNPNLNAIRFNGDFDLNTERIEDVLDAFTAVNFFEYSYKNNVVTIKQ